MTTEQLSQKIGISTRALTRRCRDLSIPKKLVKRRWVYILNEKQIDEVTNYPFRKEIRISPKVEIIRIETVYHIYPSKINYLNIDIL
jgi:hypothetical protein